MSQSQQDTIAQLAATIATADGSTFFDAEHESAKAPVRAKALRLLGQRMRSREELRRRLQEDQRWAPTLIDEVLADLVAAHLINDREFAEQWVRQRSRVRGKSRAVLNRELAEKGVNEGDRAAALAQITPESEEAVAQALAAKKAATIRHRPSDYAQRQKDLRRVLGVLARRGYSHELSMHVASRALAEHYDNLAPDAE